MGREDFTSYLYVLYVAFYECVSWSVSVKEEHRPRVFENRMPRRVFGPKRENVTAEWIKCRMYFVTVNKLRRMRLAGRVERIGDKRVKGFGRII